MAQDRIVVLREYPNELDAAIDREHLDSNGIISFISKDDAGGMRPHLQFTLSVRLLIHEKDRERAIEVLDAMEGNHDSGEDEN